MSSPSKKRLYITGIPTAGKSYLSERLAERYGGLAIHLDDIREKLASDPRYEPWVNFYSNQDEKTYYGTTSPETQWENFVRQTEALWPPVLEKITSYRDEEKPIIFDGVSILPHLARTYLDFPGVILVGRSFKETLERIKKDPRWGRSYELQEMEAHSFFYVERPRFITEAKKFGLPVFESADDAFETACELLE